ncbi:hypothetical protein GCM10009804_06180 [Kribbella hippodromi]|uniref:Uncharacterized protein n=1 Tax=Kribbella hippodromi TaxID=434347 RepID=A0ABN2C3V9_9ACTN
MSGQEYDGWTIGRTAHVHMGAAKVEMLDRDLPPAEQGGVRVLKTHATDNSSLSEVNCQVCEQE